MCRFIPQSVYLDSNRNSQCFCCSARTRALLRSEGDYQSNKRPAEERLRYPRYFMNMDRRSLMISAAVYAHNVETSALVFPPQTHKTRQSL